MSVTVEHSQLKGTIQAPASKSSMQRACAAALLAGGTTTIINPGISNDDKAAMDIISRLGAKLSNENGELTVTGSGVFPVSDQINCGESGLSIRMFTPIAALSNRQITISGSGSLSARPMSFFDEVLPQLGISVHTNDGKLPLLIQGPLTPVDITIDGSLSSQFLTGMLMAYSAAGASAVSITVSNLKSRPYIDLTLDVMNRFGMHVPENRNYESFYFPPRPAAATQDNKIRQYTVEGDWSGGAFLLVAAAIAGKITVRGLDVQSTQADKAVLQALMDAGANFAVAQNAIEIGPAALRAFQFNATDCPDLFPPLVALAANCSGTSIIEGVGRLAHKESNRAFTLQDEFAKMGVRITLKDDLMLIEGGSVISGANVHSRHDHRIAMACAVCALKASSPVTIEEADAINKSYPEFYENLQRLGAKIK